jgi:YbbR domain-containing protein
MDRLPKKNLTAKIVAFIMAVILWVYVMNEQNPPIEVNMEVPLEVRSISSTLVPADIPEVVKIRVRGPRASIVGLSKQDVKAYIDLKGLAEGVNTAKIHTAIPTNVEVVEVIPDKVTFRLDSLVSRQVPVEVKLTGTPATEAIVEKITFSSTNIVVEGPKSLLDTAVRAIAQVDISGKEADFTISTPLILVDKNGKEVEEGLTLKPGNVSVSLTFGPSIVKKSVDIKVNTVGELMKGIVLKQIITNPQKVEISGNAKILGKIDFVYAEPVNLAGIDKNAEIEVKLQGKEGITLSKKSVKVIISVTKE